jgi:hypothetical protein
MINVDFCRNLITIKTEFANYCFSKMNHNTERLQTAIAPYREALISHPLYASIFSISDIQSFMEHHVFAVWDFMSLLKYLQINLTCTSIPWMPVGSANTRFLINEIVTGEESDVDQHGNRTSHFELYLKAMNEIGCDTKTISQLIHHLQSGNTIAEAIAASNLPDGPHKFLNQTFEFIHTNKPHVVAAVFTFGREDLIPDMFIEIIKTLKAQFPDQLETLHYYIERHIEVDGGHHSHLALEMTEELCGDDEQKWKEATESTIAALQSRKLLWDSVLEKLNVTVKA